MTGFGLLIGHLLGDYILQNDWMAKNKVGPPVTEEQHGRIMSVYGDVRHAAINYYEWAQRWKGHLACTVHCLLYTLAVWACSFWWMPWWGLVVTFAAHWPIDRFRLARRWMVRVSGQKEFATGPLSPWSIIIVDNVFHLLTLFLIAVAAGMRC